MKALMVVWFFLMVMFQAKAQNAVLVSIPSLQKKGVEASLAAAHYPRNLVPFVLHSDCKRPLLPTEVRRYREATYCVPVVALETNTTQERDQWYSRFITAEQAFISNPRNASYIIPSVIIPANFERSHDHWTVSVQPSSQRSTKAFSGKTVSEKNKAANIASSPIVNHEPEPISHAIVQQLLVSGQSLYLIAVPVHRRDSFEELIATFGAQNFYRFKKTDSFESAP